MTMMVGSAATPRALQRAKKRRAGAKPAPAHTPTAPRRAGSPATSAAAGVQALTQTLPAAAPTAAPAAGAPAAAPAPAAPEAPEGPVSSPEYDPVDLAGIIGDIAGGTTGEFVGPEVSAAVAKFLDEASNPWFGTPYGKVVPGKVAGTVTGQVAGAVGSIVGNAMHGVLHGKVAGVGEPEPGLGWKPTPANKMIAGLVKGISTSWMKLALTEALKPPPPPPAPIYPPDVHPLPPAPVPAPPAPKKVLLTDTSAIRDGITSGIIGTAISAVYDQTVGPLVQRAANVVTGRADEPVKPPKPITPGGLVNGLVDGMLSSMLVRSVSYAPLPSLPGAPPPAAGTPFAGAFSASIVNGILGAAWSTVYSRGLGTAIENGVNQLAGVRSKEETEAAKLPALEHFTRAATRGVAVGATTYVLGNALTKSMVALGAKVGGVGGAIIAMAGAALIGSIGGTAVDATVGPMLGKLGGQIYSWITGKPTYEERATSPGPTPGDPVKAPNGNPGTVPAPAPGAPAAPSAPAAPAPAAPAAGAPKKRKKTGNAAVDRTSPAIGYGAAKLAAIAVKG